MAGVEKERRGEFGQTGDAHFTMTGWVESGEGKRGREGGRADVEVWGGVGGSGGGGGGIWLCFCRGHTKKRNRMVNLARQTGRDKTTTTKMS